MPKLLFCMTPGFKINRWKSLGILNRELKPYLEYVRRGWKVKILIFDRDKIPELPEGIEGVCFPYPRQLLWFLPWTHKKLGKWADVIKTSQSRKAYFYTRAAKHWKKPILLRCGYVRGEQLETTKKLTPKVKFYQWLEAKAFRGATYCQVPTEKLSRWVQKRYNTPKEKISVVSNFVDTDIFKPVEGFQKKDKSIISIGRLVPIKRFDLLIKACAEIPGCTVTIVGEGQERQYLECLAKELEVNLNLPGTLPNEELPKILHEHQIFAITSKWEGNPKALIEAMACGMPCLGVKAIGIENIIKHNENGWLVGTNLRQLAEGLSTLLKNGDVRNKLSKGSREYALKHCSFITCFNKEFRVIKMLKEHHNHVDRKHSNSCI